LIEEPIALQPGLRIVPTGEQPSLRRADAGTSPLPAPHRPAVRSGTEAAAIPAGTRQIIDEPHPQTIPTPHYRPGVEAPVERALRQLQGGLS
jgi:hypothetical protein